MFSWTRKETQFQQTCRKFRQKTWSFFPWIHESEKINSFQKNIPQTFPMDAKNAVSTKLLKLFFTKSRQFFVHCQQVIKKNASKTFSFNKMFFLDTWKAVLTKLSDLFRQNARKKFAHWPTMIRNHMFSSGNIFPHSVPVDMQNVLLKTPSTFSTSRQKIVTQKPKKRRKILILKENRSL